MMDDDHKEIWLQPWCKDCEAHSHENREWCSRDEWGECEECGAKAVRYVLASEAEKTMSTLQDEIDKLS